MKTAIELYRTLIELFLMTSGQMLNEYLKDAEKASRGKVDGVRQHQEAITQIGLRMERLLNDNEFKAVMNQLSDEHRHHFRKTLEVMKNLYVYLDEVQDYDSASEVKKVWKQAYNMYPWRDPKATA